MPAERRPVVYPIPTGAQAVACKGKGCGVPIYWVKTANGADMPIEAAEGPLKGQPHWAHCIASQTFKRGREAGAVPRAWPAILFVAYRGRELRATREDAEARRLLAEGWRVERYARATDGWPGEGAKTS